MKIKRLHMIDEPNGENLAIVKRATDCVMDAIDALPEKDRVFLALCLCMIIETQIDVESLYTDSNGVIHARAARAVDMN